MQCLTDADIESCEIAEHNVLNTLNVHNKQSFWTLEGIPMVYNGENMISSCIECRVIATLRIQSPRPHAFWFNVLIARLQLRFTSSPWTRKTEYLLDLLLSYVNSPCQLLPMQWICKKKYISLRLRRAHLRNDLNINICNKLIGFFGSEMCVGA